MEGKCDDPHPEISISCIGVCFLTISLVNNLYEFIISMYHRSAPVVSYKLCMGIIFVTFSSFLLRKISNIRNSGKKQGNIVCVPTI